MSKEIYRSKNGKYYFTFRIIKNGSIYDVFCDKHPGFNGKDSVPEKIHLYRSGRLCFVKHKEPRTYSRAKELAKQWAEYIVDYRQTGKVQK